jgi:hypothetical protein
VETAHHSILGSPHSFSGPSKEGSTSTSASMMLARASCSSACACARAVLGLFCLCLAPFETFCRPPASAAFLPFLRPSGLAVSALTFASHVAIELASSGKPFATEDVDGVCAPARALEETELRSGADFRVAGPTVFEDAAETEAGRELPVSEGTTLCLLTLGLWLVAL